MQRFSAKPATVEKLDSYADPTFAVGVDLTSGSLGSVGLSRFLPVRATKLRFARSRADARAS